VKLDIHPVLPQEPQIEILPHGDPRVPPYYTGMIAKPLVKQIWQPYSLLVVKQKSADAHYLNVLVPYDDATSPYSTQPLGTRGVILRGASDVIAVTAAGNTETAIAPDAGLAVVRYIGNEIDSYALSGGLSLTDHTMPLVRIALKSKDWVGIYDPIATVSVSIKDHRASISLPLTPFDTRVMNWWPGTASKVGNQNADPIAVDISFRIDAAPKELIGYRSVTDRPDAIASLPRAWPNDYHIAEMREKSLPFQYNSTTQMLTVTLDGGINQLAWYQ